MPTSSDQTETVENGSNNIDAQKSAEQTSSSSSSEYSVDDFQKESILDVQKRLAEKEGIEVIPDSEGPEDIGENKEEDKKEGDSKIVKMPESKTEPAKVSRDYSGLDANETHLFKNMSNEAYALLRPIYDSHKQGNKGIDSNNLPPDVKSRISEAETLRWYDHPEAYRLTPEYSQIVDTNTRLTFERQYWTQQLALLEEGKQANSLSIDDKQQYFAGDPLEANGQSKAFILGKLQEVSAYQTQAQQKAAEFSQSFTNKYGAIQNNFKALDAKIFPKDRLDIEGKHKKLFEDSLAQFPPEVRGRADTQFMAKMLIFGTHLLQENADLRKQLEVGAAVKKTARSSSPPPGGGGGSKTKLPGDDIKDWDRFN